MFHPPATGTASITFSGGGSVHAADAVAQQAQTDATAAYNTSIVATQACTTTYAGNQDLTLVSPLTAGVYCSTSSFTVSGALVLNAAGVSDALFIFRTASSTLVTATGSTVSMINPGTSECNVFWRIGSSATLGTNSTFLGNILASTNIALQTGAVLTGRALAQTAAVTMDHNTITAPLCMTAAAPTNTPTATATSAAANATATAGAATVIAGNAVPGGANNGYRAPDFHHELTPSPVASAVPAVPTVALSTPAGGISPELAALLRKVPEATVTPAPTPRVPVAPPKTGGGYGQQQLPLLLASVAMGGLFAISVWLRKRRKS